MLVVVAKDAQEEVAPSVGRRMCQCLRPEGTATNVHGPPSPGVYWPYYIQYGVLSDPFGAILCACEAPHTAIGEHAYYVVSIKYGKPHSLHVSMS